MYAIIIIVIIIVIIIIIIVVIIERATQYWSNMETPVFPCLKNLNPTIWKSNSHCSPQALNSSLYFKHQRSHPVFLLLRSPGFGLSLVAESTSGALLSVQMASTAVGEGQPIVPEDLGKQAAHLLLEEIYRVLWLIWLAFRSWDWFPFCLKPPQVGQPAWHFALYS